MAHLQQPHSADTRETFWRTLLTFAVTRIVIAVVILLYLTFNFRKDASQYLLYWEAGIAYLILAGGFAALAVRYRRHFLMQLWAQIATDLAVMSIIYLSVSGSHSSGLALLYLFPVAGGAILAPMLHALFFAAGATIFLLAESAYQILELSNDASMSQAGMYGAAFFAAAVVVNRLAARLIAEETLAHQRGIDLRLQEAINRLVIADMGDGILVIGPDEEILTANPAAERMLGLDMPYTEPYCRLTDVTALMPIADAFSLWRARVHGAAPGQAAMPMYVVIKPGDDFQPHGPVAMRGSRRDPALHAAAHLQLRFASADTEDLGTERTVIFLQDVTEIENKAQQLKLASMGRLTASIAHEVRNPLSAIAHASSLLGEEAATPMQARLLTIVAENVARLNRMIEDILKLSRKAQPHHEPLALGPFMADLLEEFNEMHQVPEGMIELGRMDRYRIWFDPLHLREVVTNLLSNALRYASGKPGSIRIQASPDPSGRLELHVQDDGAPISQEVRAHLFEPFYTTSSKGTGLGLYLARELCLNNGAVIDYEYRAELSGQDYREASGRFVITFAASDEAAAAPSGTELNMTRT